MGNMLLTPYDGAILGPIAKLLGWVMNGIYSVTSNLFGIENVGLSIILLTIVIYTLLLPLTIKQQKFSKLSQKMQPELKAIQEKYKNKKDQASVMAMNQETQILYAKYGISSVGSCAQLLIQMPILFALYRVFYNIPAYITTVKDKFTAIADEIYAYDGFAKILTNVTKDLKINVQKLDLVVSESNTVEDVKNHIVDILYKMPSVEKLVTPNADGEVYFKNLSTVGDIVNSGVEEFYEFNHFFGLNISDTPWNIVLDNFSAKNFALVVGALCIPLFAYVSQVLSIKLATARSKESSGQGNEAMMQQMETMNKIMPLMSLFFCFSMPVGLGIYWIISAVVRTVQMLVINRYVDNMDLEKLLEKNEAKARAKMEKMGVYQNQIRNAASINTRNVNNDYREYVSTSDREAQLNKASELKANANPNSLAARANMVREYNERNSHK